MSHISKLNVKTELKNEEILKKALNDLKTVFTNLEIKKKEYILRALSMDNLEKSEIVDYLVDIGNGFQIGLKNDEGIYDIVVDKWYWEVHNKEDLLNKFTNKIQDFYLLEELKQNAEEEGYTVNWVYNREKEEIELEMEKW